jgi:alpha-glucosidase
LAWHQSLIQLRRENPALHDGTLTMLNVNDNNVLSWLRKTRDGQLVLVACSFTAQTQPRRLRLLKTLLQTPGSPELDSPASVKLPAYGVYIGEVQ